MSGTKQLLERAKCLIERGWCQGTYARDDRGFSVPTDFRTATCFCTLGALFRSAGVDDEKSFTRARASLDKVVARRGFTYIPEFNDDPSTAKEDVLSAFDEAIAEVTS